MAITDLIPHISTPPPGLQRHIPPPHAVGKAPFAYPVTPNADGTSLWGETAYYVWGDIVSGESVPLIAVHGGPGMTHKYMLPFALLHLDYGIPVILYDQIGCGRSTRHKDRVRDNSFWTTELFTTQLQSLVKQLRLEQFDLLGHSWGGFLAGSFVVNMQPAGLRKLVISNSPTQLAAIPATVEKLVANMPLDIQTRFRQCQEKQDFESADDKAVEAYIFALHSCRVPQPWPKELMDTMMAVAEDDVCTRSMVGNSVLLLNGSLATSPGLGPRLDEITEVTCPGGILVVTAEHDLLAGDSCMEWWTKPRARTTRTHFPLSSHFVMFEETEGLMKTVGEFLTSVELASGEVRS